MPETALVLGATGSFGGAVMLELVQRGWKVTALARDPTKLRPPASALPVSIASGDAQDADAVAHAARGVSVIVHGVNYPYQQWVPHMRRVTEKVIDAAELSGATVVFPGNVYGFGPSAGRPFVETDSFKPNTRKGKLRVELERLLAAAAGRGKARVLIVRAGDYFGPTVRNGLVDPIFGNAARRKSMLLFGDPDIPHQWSFVSDVARLTADLLAMRDKLNAFEIAHHQGEVLESNRHLCKLVAIAAGEPNLTVRRVPWWALRVIGAFNGVVGELMEMRYLFDTSVVIDDPRRRKLVPDFTNTPLEVALQRTVHSYRA